MNNCFAIFVAFVRKNSRYYTLYTSKCNIVTKYKIDIIDGPHEGKMLSMWHDEKKITDMERYCPSDFNVKKHHTNYYGYIIILLKNT